MKKVFVASVFFASIFVAVASASAITVRSMADQRIWQTAMNPSASLTWPWENDSDSATVTFSNRLTGVVSQYAVSKVGGELYGEVAPPVTLGVEAFFAVGLTLLSGGSEVARYEADVAYVNGVAGRAFNVQDPGCREWRRVPAARLSTYDSAWLSETAEASEAALAMNGGTPDLLPGTSGYLVLKSAEIGDARVDLGFDEDPDVWTAFLRFGVPGLMMLFK